MLERYSWKEAALVSLVRIFIIGFMFGSGSSIMYSLAGATLSLMVMIFFAKIRWASDNLGVSVAGGVFPQYRAAAGGDSCHAYHRTIVLLCSGADGVGSCDGTADWGADERGIKEDFRKIFAPYAFDLDIFHAGRRNIPRS